MIRSLLRCTAFLLFLTTLPLAARAGERALRFAADGDLAWSETRAVVTHHREFTIALWAWPESTGSEQRLASLEFERGNKRLRYLVGLDSSAHPTIRVEETPEAPLASGTLMGERLALTKDRWHFVAATMVAGRLRLFVDGQLLGDTLLDCTSSAWEDGRVARATRRIELGGVRRTDAYGRSEIALGYRGLLDEIQLWNRTMGIDELVLLHQHIPETGSSGLVGWWRHDAAHPDVATDAAQHCGDLRLEGGAGWTPPSEALALISKPIVRAPVRNGSICYLPMKSVYR